MRKRFLVTALFVAATLTVTASLPFPKEAGASKMQPGYMIKDRLLRPALVGVAKKPE